jgi:hypothetical protein
MKKWLFLILIACAIMYYFLPMIDDTISDSYNEEFGEIDPDSVYDDEDHPDNYVEIALDKIKEFFENLFDSDESDESNDEDGYIYR